MLARIEVRQFQPSDIAAAARLLGELGYPSSVIALAARLDAVLESEVDFVLVAVHEHRLVGFASVHLIPLVHRDGFVARLTSFVVTNTMRRRRLGSSLLEACQRHARAFGAERMEVTSGDSRSGAHAFYVEGGFHREGQRFTKRLVSE